MSGLLIVNADDWGGKRAATDGIEACFEAGAISSTTAMVWMADSDRAAARLEGRRWPIGLHLNLTQLFDGADVPAEQRDRQARLVAAFADRGAGPMSFRPGQVSAVKAALNDQLERFRDLYGVDPTHIDGHQHVHLNPTILSVLPKGIRLRPAQSGPNGDRGGLMRQLRHALLARRFRVPDRFHAIESLHPELGGTELTDALTASDTEVVEIMCHPSRPEQLEVLLSPKWAALLAGHRLGSYADLQFR